MIQKHFFTRPKWLIFFLCSVLMLANSLLAETQKFRFGISAPLSGILAEYGTAVRNGVDLAKKDFAAELGHIDILFEDAQWDPKIAVSVFSVLRNQKKAHLIYNWGSFSGSWRKRSLS